MQQLFFQKNIKASFIIKISNQVFAKNLRKKSRKYIKAKVHD